MKDSGADKPKTVKFNVGGKEFEVSRELIEKNEGSMLARMVSDTWQEDPTKPVFIDRDYDIFSSVLGYLRYGSIVLPHSIDRDMFLRDMDYYGIVHNYDTVKISLATKAVGLMNSLQEAELKRDITLIATYCFKSILLNKNINNKNGASFSIAIYPNIDSLLRDRKVFVLSFLTAVNSG